jgi:exodeoxyribonuclease VII large subunit
LRKKTGFVRQEWSNLVSRLERAVRETLVKGLGSVEHLSARLEGLSPLAVLSRGYSITVSRDTGAVIKDVASVAIGEDVRVRLHRGEIDCRVTGKIASGE